MKPAAFLLIILMALVSGPTAFADGMMVVRDTTVPVPMSHFQFAPLDIRQHHVKVRIDDQVAVTEVDQIFYNSSSQRLEADYIFPIPAGASITRFSMDIDGRTMDAEMLDAPRARDIYESIVRRRKDPALLEYAGQGMFRVRVFPIEPLSEKRVRISYAEILKADNGIVRYLYGLNTQKFSASPIKSVRIDSEIRSSRSIRTVYSPSHYVNLNRSNDASLVTANFAVEDARPDTDFVLYYSTVGTGAGQPAVSLLTFDDTKTSTAGSGPRSDGFFMLLVTPPPAAQTRIVQKDVVFVLDTSGSMGQDNARKLEQARKALSYCIGALNDGDRFEVIRFSTDTEALFDGLVDASLENRAKALNFVRNLRPVGGTAIDEGLNRAVESIRKSAKEDRPRSVIFLTDGQPTIGTTDEGQILDRLNKAIGTQNIRVFSFGIGSDLNTHLLDKITEKTRAVSQYVLPSEDIEAKLSNFYARINNPALSDLKLSVAGGKVQISGVYPAPLPDLFVGDQLIVMGRFSGEGDAAVTLEGTMNGQQKKIVFDGRFERKATEYGFLPGLWAVRRVGYLLDEIRLHGENAERKNEVTQLARQYGIVTPYTAYLILEDEARRNVPLSQRTIKTGAPPPGVPATSSTGVPIAGGARGGGAPAAAAVERALSQRSDVYKEGKTGLDSIADSRTSYELKSAVNAQGLERAKVAQQNGVWGGAGDSAANQAAFKIANQNAKLVKGRSFYQDGNKWVDAQAQSKTGAQGPTVKFGGDEYFGLLEKHPDAAAWLAVGTNLQLVLDDVVYEIVE